MKNLMLKAIALSLVFVLCIGLASCKPGGKNDGISTDVYEGDVIYVGNTAATTGALATIGVPFNLGIEAAFAAYNAKGGFNGKTVALKHYDDMGDTAQAVTLMEKLIHEDEIFAVVGNYGTYAVAANIDILKENCVPMVYAAAGNNVLFNANATEDGDRCIFPVQPLNQAEGQMLILRAFAPAFEGETYLGGLGGTKVGVISNSDEASQAMLAGIKAEAEKSGLSDVIYQNVTTDDYSAAASALQAAGCDVVIVTVVGTPFISALTALANVNYDKNVLTTYNNANAAVFNNESNTMTEAGLNILSKMTVYAQAWLDITSLDYYFNEKDAALYKYYSMVVPQMLQKDEAGNVLGVPGFTESYWEVAKNIYNYVVSIGRDDGFSMSYNSYALAGYIAGDLFCQALEEMEAQGKELTRANLVDILESKKFQVAMADMISYQNGERAGVQSFSLTVFYDTNTVTNDGNHVASSMTVHPLTSMDEYRALIGK